MDTHSWTPPTRSKSASDKETTAEVPEEALLIHDSESDSLGRLDLEKYLPFLISHLEGLIAEDFASRHKHMNTVTINGTTSKLVRQCCRLLGTAERCLMQLVEHDPPGVSPSSPHINLKFSTHHPTASSMQSPSSDTPVPISPPVMSSQESAPTLAIPVSDLTKKLHLHPDPGVASPGQVQIGSGMNGKEDSTQGSKPVFEKMKCCIPDTKVVGKSRLRRVSEPALKVPVMFSFGTYLEKSKAPQEVRSVDSCTLRKRKEFLDSTLQVSRRSLPGNSPESSSPRKFPSSLLDDIRPGRSPHDSNPDESAPAIVSLSASLPNTVATRPCMRKKLFKPSFSECSPGAPKSTSYQIVDAEREKSSVDCQSKISLPQSRVSNSMRSVSMPIHNLVEPVTACDRNPESNVDVYISPKHKQAASKIQSAYRSLQQRNEAEWDRLIQEELESCKL